MYPCTMSPDPTAPTAPKWATIAQPTMAGLKSWKSMMSPPAITIGITA